MTELMHFQPGKALYDAYQQGRGNYLAGQAFNSQGDQRQSALGQLAGLNPDKAMALKADFDEQDKADFTEFSNVILNAPEDLKPQIYAKGVQRFGHKIRALGVEPPADYKQAMPLFQQLSQASGGKPKARSSHILADGTIAYMDEFGNLTRTGEKASNTYGFQTDAQGNVYAQDKRGGTVAPAPMGSVQQGMPQVQQGADPMAGGLDRINQGVAVLKANGVPVERINEWADAEFAKLQGSVQQGVVEQAPAQAPSQAKVAVKGDELTPYQAESLDIKREAAERARVASEAALAAKKRADEAADGDRKGRVAAAKQTTDNLLTNIRALKKHPGFPQLGTVGGNAADQMLPEFMPTEYRGAKGRLETIKGQIALQAMASLKALSSSGATGFGALAVPELNLLQNSIQTLTTSQNNSDILAAINQIETLLTKAGQAGQAAPAASGKQVGRFVIEEN